MEQEALKLIEEMIRSNPVSGKKEVLNSNVLKLKGYLEKHKVLCSFEEYDGFRILYASTVPGKNPDFLLNAHLDVVPPIEPEQTNPVVKDGVLYGRGSSDCIACSICIAEFLTRCAGKASVGAFFSMDEEVGGFTTGIMAERGYLPQKSIIIIDADFGSIAYAQKGVFSLKLKSVGKGGHSSAPWKLVNPIDRLMDGYQKLRSIWKNPPSDSDNWHDSMAGTVIGGGQVFNQVPDTAEMVLNFRFTEKDGDRKILQLVRETTGLEVEILGLTPPVVLDSNDPELLRMKKCFEDVLGKECPVYRMNGATDAHHFSASGLPILILGLEGSGCHTAHENLKLNSYDKMLSVLERYTVKYCPQA